MIDHAGCCARYLALRSMRDVVEVTRPMATAVSDMCDIGDHLRANDLEENDILIHVHNADKPLALDASAERKAVQGGIKCPTEEYHSSSLQQYVKRI
jgi:hypothetical protein